ncbi:MAG TPA: minichromosome maintenance protein MCM [Candidatus Diapherotrites archaeon]|nr:minichromosome maintenance protein MCM [Candidatus Diapherotrites archaeon]
MDEDYTQEFDISQEDKTSDLALDQYVDLLVEFLETNYKREIDYLASNYPNKKSLNIDYKKLEDFDLDIAETLLEHPNIIINAANLAIKRLDIGILDSELESKFEPIVRFYNLPKENLIDIRNIGNEHISKFISVEGTVRLITERLEKMTEAYFICKQCGTGVYVEQKSQILQKPLACRNCRKREFNLDIDQSKYIDYQKVQIQEPLENLKGSEQANSLDIYLSEDLVNVCSPGDKIKITGTIKLRPPKGETNIYSKYMVANHIEKEEQEYEELIIYPEEEQEIKELAKKENIYEILASSVAPHIYGQEIVKQAIVLQLFGGVNKNLANQPFRGNIHILLVGDPSTGKSAILEYCAQLAPKSIYVAGKTTSGAGLTVSAVKDEFGEGGWTLKAGAVVLASGGVAMIDEFDKMSTEDRSALHEAMAQGTVSVSKAGLYSKFKANTSILAAANPKYSRFDSFKSPLEQIDLPFSLISRFDLYFLIHDLLDRKLDKEIGEHILKTQQIAQKISSEGSLSKEEIDDAAKKILPIVSPNLFKKYVAYARQNVKPVLTKEASDKLLEYYVSLRDIGRNTKSYSATIRQLNGLIKLAEASAKIKLKKEIDADDAERAILVFKTSLEQVAIDKDSGKIDIDILTTGQSQSERNVLKNLLKLIKDLSGGDETGAGSTPVAISDIVRAAETETLPKDKIIDAIKKLKKIGDIYEPTNGFVKLTNPAYY